MFKPTDLVLGQEWCKVGFGAMLADGGGDFAGRGRSFLAQLLSFLQLGGKLAEFLLIDHATFLE